MASEDQGVFVAIEGADSQKEIQANLLKERLDAVGYDVLLLHFPQLSKESGYFAKNYLNGRYGQGGLISPYIGSLFYALDMYEASSKIKDALKSGKIVIATGFAGATMAEQGAKLNDDIEKRSYFVWADNLEYQLLDIPRPNLNFYLKQGTKTKISDKAGRLIATYEMICQLFPKDFKLISGTRNDDGIADTNNLIWNELKPLLPERKSHASKSVVVSLEPPVDSPIAGTENNQSELTHQFENASLLLRLNLQRLPVVKIIPGFNNWADSNYQFYTPGRLQKDVSQKYKDYYQNLSDIHQRLQQKLQRYLLAHKNQIKKNISDQELINQVMLPVTPLGALSSFKIKLAKNDIRTVASQLLAADSEELQWAAKQLFLAARKTWPNEFAQPLESAANPTALNDIIAKLANDKLSNVFSADESIKILDARPKIEFDLLSETIYPFSNLSLDEITQEVSNWPYAQKYDSLKTAASQSNVLNKVSYKIDILSDNITLDKIITTGKINNIQTQGLSPRYGYEMPKLIELAVADDLYDQMFDESLKVYSLLQEIGREDAVAYGTLLGHKLRWQMQASAAELKNVVTDSSLKLNPVVSTIAEQLSEAHPLLWEVITQSQQNKPQKLDKGKARVKPASRTGRPKRR